MNQKIDNYEIERKLYQEGYNFICGVDEAGRGPLVGPVVAAAVILPKNFIVPSLTDSKKLSDKKRRELYKIIIDNALTYKISVVSNKVIDKINIYEASKLAMKRSIRRLGIKPDFTLIDAIDLDIEKSFAIIKGDLKSHSIAAASILAKVYRDDLMIKLSKKYPYLDLDKHKGYPTKRHIELIKTHGFNDEYRKTFEPIKTMIGE